MAKGGKIKNWSRKQSQEKIVNRGSNDGYDREIIGYWKHDQRNERVIVRRTKTPGDPAQYKVLKKKRRAQKIAHGYNRDVANSPKLTRKQAMKKARRYMRKNP
jgi:hypothetical protein